MYQYCTNTNWSCCTPGDMRKIGDNFNRPDSQYTSKASLMKDFEKWWGVVDDIFSKKGELIKISDKIIYNAKAFKGAKKSAAELKKLLEMKDFELTTRYNANQCYSHMGSVAVGSICSICDSDALNRYDVFNKKIYLNAYDVSGFQDSCMRYIGETLPVLADLLKHVYRIASLEADQSKPKDKLKYMQAEYFDNLEIGKVESHLKCNPKITNPESMAACNNLVNSYYTQGVLLKPEYQLLPQAEKIRNWFVEMDSQQTKRMLKNRVLATVSPNIEPAEGLEQLWTKFWTIEFLPEDDLRSPMTQLTALELRSGLEDLKFTKNPKLQTPATFVPKPATWSTPEFAKKEKTQKVVKDLKQKPGKNKVLTAKMKFKHAW